MLSERHGYRISLRKWAEDSTVARMGRLSEDFPAVAQHLGDVVIHFLEIQQPALVVCAEYALLVCKGLHPHCSPLLPQLNPIEGN
jgi:hypothetical protein